MIVRKQVHIDTSVVGGYFDKEFEGDTVPFFERIKNGELEIMV